MDHLAEQTTPLYHRWVYSPTKGVTLATNQDDHPAMVKYHQEMGGDINDTDLTHGYAYPIINGWRLSDLDHQTVGDPYIVNQVVRALNQEEDPQMRSEGSWRPTEYDFSRLHYGLPQEKTASEGYGSLEEIERAHPNVMSHATERSQDGAIILHGLRVDPSLQRSGLATAYMNDLTDYADRNGKEIALTAEPYGGGPGISKQPLRRWYEGFGFIPNKGRNKDYAFKETHRRPPV